MSNLFCCFHSITPTGLHASSKGAGQIKRRVRPVGSQVVFERGRRHVHEVAIPAAADDDVDFFIRGVDVDLRSSWLALKADRNPLGFVL